MTTKTQILKAIKIHCERCMNEEEEVRVSAIHCMNKDCVLYPFRLGKDVIK